MKCRYDFNDELIAQEAEKVLSILDKCIQLGLKWNITKIDLNTKIEYVNILLVVVNGIDRIKEISILTLLLIFT